MKNRNKVQLCPNCKTGLDSYMLDCRSTECPYMLLHNGIECAMHRPIEENK